MCIAAETPTPDFFTFWLLIVTTTRMQSKHHLLLSALEATKVGREKE